MSREFSPGDTLVYKRHNSTGLSSRGRKMVCIVIAVFDDPDWVCRTVTVIRNDMKVIQVGHNWARDNYAHV